MLGVLKLILSALIIYAASELGKRSTLLGSLLISLPLISLIALTWIYVETKDTERMAAMSTNIFWLVLPSLVFFLLFPLLLRKGMPFVAAMPISLAVMVAGYLVMVRVLARLGVAV